MSSKPLFKASLGSASLRSAISNVDRTVKRDNTNVSLVADDEGRVWLEGHGPFRQMQALVETPSSEVTPGSGLTVDQKALQTLARGGDQVDIVYRGDVAQFRRKGPQGSLTGGIKLVEFDGRLTDPNAKVADETRVDLTGDQTAALAESLKRVDLVNAIAKGKSMDLWIRISPKGCRMLVFDQWHSALVKLPVAAAADSVSARIDKDLFSSVSSMPGDGLVLRIGSDVVRVSNSEFAVRSSVVDPGDGPVASDMLKVMAQVSRKAKDGKGATISMDTSSIKEIVRDLGVTGYRTEAIEIGLRKGKVVWSCKTAGGRSMLSQAIGPGGVSGEWPSETVKVSPGLLNDVVRVMADDVPARVFLGDDTMMIESEDGGMKYMLMLN